MTHNSHRGRQFAAITALCAALALTACGETTRRAPDPRVPAAPAPSAAASPAPTPSTTFQPETVTPRPAGSSEFASQTGRGTLEVNYAWHSQGAKADAVPPEHAYLVVDVKISCTEGTCYHNPAAFRVQESDDEMATFTGGKDGYGPILGTGTLQANTETSGVVTFDIARANVTLKFLDEFDQVAATAEIAE